MMKWKVITPLFYFIFLLSSKATFAQSSLVNCSVKDNNTQVITQLKFNDKISYHCMLLKDPQRLVVDLKDTDLKTTLPMMNSAFIKEIRSSDHNEFLRLVFDLDQPAVYKVVNSEDENELTVTLTAAEVKPKEEFKPKIIAEKPADPITTNEQPKPTKSEAIENHFNKNIVVVIDPGHGGKDSGACGPNGALEKDVVLKISKQLLVLLNQEPGFSAVLTRCSDCYIPLRKRLAIARKNHADMFVAIHADAYHHSQATGASVYALSQRGATSEAAKWLAEKENESELGGLGIELADKDAILRSVLIDLSQTHTIESSLTMGHKVLQHLGKLCPLHHSAVEQAAFVVLKSPDIPSILVETGFLSNPLEENKLINPAHQQQTAAAIKEGIKQYFINNSPGGTWFSDRKHYSGFMANISHHISKKSSKNKKAGHHAYQNS